jgi:hypothetical protein
MRLTATTSTLLTLGECLLILSLSLLTLLKGQLQLLTLLLLLVSFLEASSPSLLGRARHLGRRLLGPSRALVLAVGVKDGTTGTVETVGHVLRTGTAPSSITSTLSTSRPSRTRRRADDHLILILIRTFNHPGSSSCRHTKWMVGSQYFSSLTAHDIQTLWAQSLALDDLRGAPLQQRLTSSGQNGSQLRRGNSGGRELSRVVSGPYSSLSEKTYLSRKDGFHYILDLREVARKINNGLLDLWSQSSTTSNFAFLLVGPGSSRRPPGAELVHVIGEDHKDLILLLILSGLVVCAAKRQQNVRQGLLGVRWLYLSAVLRGPEEYPRRLTWRQSS